MGITIVAIPREDDYVWKISSEKIPHVTILALGTVDDEKNTMEFVEHVAKTTLCRFGLSVDYRGELGPDKADVLFFDKKYAKSLEAFRGNLLKDKSIFLAYNKVEQYPEWTPHLTLGYPTTPAKPDDRDYPTSWVSFDRIAVWTSDYEGTEFRLDEDGISDAVAYGNMPFDEALIHFGIKGMKWGVHAKQIEGTAALVGKATAIRKDPTKTASKTKAGQEGGLHKVSDKDLQAMINRMEMEKKFNKFMQEDKERRVEGVKAIGKILGEIGKVAVPIVLGVVANRVMNNRSTFRTSAFVNRPVIEG